MPRKFFQKLVPSSHEIKQNKSCRFLHKLLHNPNNWHFNRQSVAGAFAVGLFFAWFPLPSQIVYSAIAAIWLRVNLPISVSLIWITNPITIPPFFYFAYKVGAYILGEEIAIERFELSMEWLGDSVGQIWQPLMVGSLLIGVVSAIIGYFAIHLVWRLHISHRWKKRRKDSEK